MFNFLTHWGDTAPGMSGSGMYDTDNDGGTYIVAVHTATSSDPAIRENYAVVLTTAVLDVLAAWHEQMESS